MFRVRPAFVLLARCAARTWASQPADLVFINGSVYTVDAARSWASAVAIRRDTVVFVGTDDGVKQYVTPKTRIIDLKHRMLLPGFQDSHAHPGMAPNPGTQFDLAGLRDTRHTLAHLSLVDAADVPRFRRLGVIANMTPLWSRGDPWQTVFAPRMFGPERAAQTYKTRTLLDAGTVLVWGSDWPVTGVSPLDGLETAITHRYPGGRDPSGAEDTVWNAAERLSLEQAIVAYTAAGAFLVHDERRRGSIQPGKAADLVVLSRNLFETPPDEIHAVEVEMTVLGGRVIYDRSSADAARSSR